jgi:stage V sporulation protein SpoVS
MPVPPQTLLIAGFLAIIGAVPLGQLAWELSRRERVQAVDLVRYAPTERNLRAYERTLEDKSWFRQLVRPPVQRGMLTLLGDAGPSGLLGRDGWAFYKPDVRYLVEPDAPRAAAGAAGAAGAAEGSAWVQPGEAAVTHGQAVAAAIAHFRDQLAERGIRLLVVPVPGKPSIYPDRLTRRTPAAGTQQPAEFRTPTADLLEALARRDVATVDLLTVFRQARRGELPDGELYLARDTHWTPAGMRLAAEAVAGKLRELGWAPTLPRQYATRRVRVARHGDVLQMIRVGGLHDRFPAELVECFQVLDPSAGPLVPHAGSRDGTFTNPHLKDRPGESSVLLLGDSFSRIYQLREPMSLGEVLDASAASQPQRRPREGGPPPTKRLLPGSAGLPATLAWALHAPVDYIVSDGGAATDVRQMLSTNPDALENKRVVVWQFVERDVALGGAGWRDVPLPPRRQ